MDQAPPRAPHRRLPLRRFVVPAKLPEPVSPALAEHAEERARDVQNRVSDQITRFAGSMTVKPSTLIAIIHDYVLSLARHGFRRFFFINGHGGNIATVQAAFSEIYAAFERYKWFVIGAVVVVAWILIARRVRRGRAAAGS